MQTIKECIDQVNASNGLDCEECHASTRIVSRALSGLEIAQCTAGTLATWSAELKRVALAGERKVYRVDIDQFGHSFAVAQCGEHVVVMQSWIGCYSLQDWMIGTAESLKANTFLPKNGQAHYSVLSLYMNVISKDLHAREDGNVLKYGVSLFNPTAARRRVLEMALRQAAGYPLSLKWDSRPIL